VDNPRYIEPTALATTNDEYFKKLGMKTPIVVNNIEGDNNKTEFKVQQRISSEFNENVWGGGMN